MIERELLQPNIQSSIQIFICDFSLFDDFSHGWNNIIFAMSIYFRFFFSLRNLEGSK